jgi:Fanconi anemia group M protein
MAKIIVDTREASDIPITISLMEAGFEVEEKFLPVGDYYIPGEPFGYVIDRKTIFDLLNAIREGRLISQLKNLAMLEHDQPLIILEGSISLPEKTGREWRKSSIIGELLSIEVDWKIPVIPLPSISRRNWVSKDLVTTLKVLCDRVGKVKGERPLRFVPKEVPLSEQQRYLIEGLPGVSAVRAEALLKHFGTPLAVFNATEEQLLEVEGIGEVTARKIQEVLRTPYKPTVTQR